MFLLLICVSVVINKELGTQNQLEKKNGIQPKNIISTLN